MRLLVERFTMHDSEDRKIITDIVGGDSLSLSLSLSLIVDEGGRCSVSAGAQLLFVGFEPERLHFTLPRGLDKEAYNRGGAEREGRRIVDT